MDIIIQILQEIAHHPLLLFSIIYGVGSLYGIYLIYESRKESKEIFCEADTEKCSVCDGTGRINKIKSSLNRGTRKR